MTATKFGDVQHDTFPDRWKQKQKYLENINTIKALVLLYIYIYIYIYICFNFFVAQFKLECFINKGIDIKILHVQKHLY